MLNKLINLLNKQAVEDGIRRYVEVEYRSTDADYAFYLINQGLSTAEIKRRMR